MSIRTPALPDPPYLGPENEALRMYLRDVAQALRNYFREAADPATIGAPIINVPADRFPTIAEIDSLRSGDFYVDTSNFVRMKP